jgi:hypothetical protein
LKCALDLAVSHVAAGENDDRLTALMVFALLSDSVDTLRRDAIFRDYRKNKMFRFWLRRSPSRSSKKSARDTVSNSLTCEMAAVFVSRENILLEIEGSCLFQVRFRGRVAADWS